ncbi:MAG TPA: hypothetical protein PLV68_14625, partial [Ilumatobacteraceae bacterium]|nr:hypothetical protein [Ilumatobacteraceae bacterium]
MGRRANIEASVASLRAEAAAFDGTALDWQAGAEGLCGEARAFMESMWWTSTFGPRRCGVEPTQRASPRSSECFSLGGGPIEMRFSDTAKRYEVFRQLAVAATLITRRGTSALGPEWR